MWFCKKSGVSLVLLSWVVVHVLCPPQHSTYSSVSRKAKHVHQVLLGTPDPKMVGSCWKTVKGQWVLLSLLHFQGSETISVSSC